MAFYVLAFGGTLCTMLGAGIVYLETLAQPADRGENVRTITAGSASAAVSEALPTVSPTPSLTASPPASPDPAKDKITLLEDEVAELINRERAGKCAALRADERLRYAARAHSTDMAAKNYFSHNGLDGSSFVDRLQEAGYPRGEAAAENIAVGYPTAQAVVAGWMNSPDHKANILHCSHKAAGVGLAYRGDTPYWTQDFGRS